MKRVRRRRSAWFRHRDDGFSTVWVLGLSVIVLVLGTAVFDVWQVFGTQRTLTARADAAAAAAAQAVDVASYEGTPSRLQLLDGRADEAGSAANLAKARLQKDLPAGTPLTVTVVTSDSCSGTPANNDVIVCIKVDNGTSNQPTVTVTLKRQVNFTIFRLLGYSSQTVTASGTAGPR